MLDPDLWNDDGTAKAPTQERMDTLEELQSGESGAFFNYARIKRDAKAERPPEVGDIVHFWGGGQCRAAIVIKTETFNHNCELNVFFPRELVEQGEEFVRKESEQFWYADHDEGRVAETWHWPCGEGQ